MGIFEIKTKGMTNNLDISKPMGSKNSFIKDGFLSNIKKINDKKLKEYFWK